jgi:hypothetical protein
LSISADMTYTIHIQYSETSAAGGFFFTKNPLRTT